jgi:16S rRNA C967 or C1407 C5-methylase (RsmB/RsmF family)
MKVRKKKGEEAFIQYYQELYADRWDSLKDSLLAEEIKYPRPHMGTVETEYNVDKAFDEAKSYSDSHTVYQMDYASFLCAKALPLKSGDSVLDMCAAPGGKSLILIQRLLELQGKSLIELNEVSPNRKNRLFSALEEFGHDPRKDNNNQELSIQIKGYDGLNYGIRRPEEFDSILLDAPCSSERHVLKSPGHLEKWSLKRPQGLGKKQYGLLCSAILALKSGGHVLYSTCALTPLENDDVIQKVLEKKSDLVELVSIDERISSIAEKTKFGLHFLPDHGPFGPLYMCLLKKK